MLSDNKHSDSGSEESFDSSIQLENLSRSDSTLSLPRHQQTRTVQLQNDDLPFLSSTHKQKEKRQTQVQNKEEMFIGFRNGWDMKNIEINASKMKKVQKFFESQDDKEYCSMNFSSLKKKSISKEDYNDNIPYLEQMTMPCFKTMGTGVEVKVSSAAKRKISLMFSENQSIKKPTKMKKTSKIIDQSIIKTVNLHSKQKEIFMTVPQLQEKYKIQKNDAHLNKKSFNWEQYQKAYNEEFAKRQNSKSINKKKSSVKKNRKINQNKFTFVKLSYLQISEAEQEKQSKLLAIKSKKLQQIIFSHQMSNCQIVQCVLCKVKYNEQKIAMKQIYELMNRQFNKKSASLEVFAPLYEQICFKLLKYQLYWPNIINKQLNPSNIIVQLNKKLVQREKDVNCSSLSYCIFHEQIGKKINLIVKEKVINQKMQIIFLKLSDGQCSMWAAIESHNLLYNYIITNQKVRVGTKLCLCLWHLHPISNIGQFCYKQNNQKCIEFFYNGSIILHPNAKLGFTKQQFYRPLLKCRNKGGLIPVVEGKIIRLFTIKDKGKRSKSQGYSLSNNFVQILTAEGVTCLIKFVLPQCQSLVQFFRLFYSYQFVKLKINQEKILSFLSDQSRFEELKSCKISEREMLYPEDMEKLISQRLVNNRNSDELQIGQKYDLMCKNGKCNLIDYKQFQIDIQSEDVSNQAIIYQQFTLVNKGMNWMTLRRQKHSSQLRRIPKIYEKVHNR